MTWTLLGVTGEVVSLDEPPFVMAEVPQIFGFAPVSTGVSATPALSAGARRGTSRVGARPITLPLHILADTPAELWDSVDHLTRLLDPRRGDCVLMVDRPDGDRREIAFHYTAGLTPAIRGSKATAVTVQVGGNCPHPFYRSATPAATSLEFPVSGSGLTATPFSDDTIPFSDPNTPFNGWESTAEEGTVLATLTNVGSAPAWPLWRFGGPVQGVSCANLTTGRAWEWTRAPWSELLTGETLEVRTAEQSDAVRLFSGVNRYRGLSVARDLWPLETGDNLVLIQVTGAGTQTTASVEFHPEWLTC